jgi:hypothetical protein
VETFVNIFMRFSQIAPIALAGFLYVAMPHAASAVERPIPAGTVMTAAPSTSAVPAAYYYYHGRRYPYRYHGMYFNHRYYRGGRYHYY